jgi:hypothetical protein
MGIETLTLLKQLFVNNVHTMLSNKLYVKKIENKSEEFDSCRK